VISLRSPLVQDVMSIRTARLPVRASATRVNLAALVPKPVPVQHAGSAPAPSSSEPSGTVTGATEAAGTTGGTAAATNPPGASAVVRASRRPAVRSAASQSISAPSFAGVTVSGPQASAGSQTWWKTSWSQPPRGSAALTRPRRRASVVVWFVAYARVAKGSAGGSDSAAAHALPQPIPSIVRAVS
jgi:hypothetical protein